MNLRIFFFVWPCLLVTIQTIAAFHCPSQTGTYNVADPDTKTGYYSCVNGVATLQYCATGTYFSADSGSCVAVPRAPEVNCHDGGFFQKPNPYDCTKFYKCDHGVPIPFDCPSGLHYNPTLHVCDWPQQAGCVVKQRPTTTSNNPTNNNSPTNNNYPTNNNNNPTNNNKPTNNNNQRPTTDNSNNNNNNNNQKPETNINNNEVEAIICPYYIEPGTTRLQPNPYDELGNTYYLCDSNGGMYLKFCPEGMRFNTGLGRCNEGKMPGKGDGKDDQKYHW